MGQARTPLPVLLVTAISSGLPEAFDWSEQQLESRWGTIVERGPRFEFTQTGFYQASMGTGLLKQLVALEPLIDPGQLPDIKLQTNQWEQDFAGQRESAFERPLNLDPGYLTEAKLVLATVKNREHRIYLRDGIYGEITLSYWNRQWNAHRWTYPDYLVPENVQFFDRCRQRLRHALGRL